MEPIYVICPRPCTSPTQFVEEEHCWGELELTPRSEWGKARCQQCGRYLPTQEAIEWMDWDEVARP